MSSNNHNPTLTSELKGWLDNVIVPALVREYVSRLEPEKSLATRPELAVDSPPAHAAIAEEGR